MLDTGRGTRKIIGLGTGGVLAQGSSSRNQPLVVLG
jgi:hypothetical protein